MPSYTEESLDNVVKKDLIVVVLFMQSQVSAVKFCKRYVNGTIDCSLISW